MPTTTRPEPARGFGHPPLASLLSLWRTSVRSGSDRANTAAGRPTRPPSPQSMCGLQDDSGLRGCPARPRALRATPERAPDERTRQTHHHPPHPRPPDPLPAHVTSGHTAASGFDLDCAECCRLPAVPSDSGHGCASCSSETHSRPGTPDHLQRHWPGRRQTGHATPHRVQPPTPSFFLVSPSCSIRRCIVVAEMAVWCVHHTATCSAMVKSGKDSTWARRSSSSAAGRAVTGLPGRGAGSSP